MNVEVYLFGDLGSGYTQYIDDDSRNLFKSVVAKSKANSQLVIHRDDTLMYYIYVRRLHNAESSNSRYLGICYALNNRFIRNIEGLFSIFEGAITTIASRGHLLEYTNNGNIVASVGKIYNVKSEFAHISAYLKTELDSFMADRNDTLPTLDYSINTSEIKTFKFTDNKQDILKASSTYSTIYVFKDDNYENEESKSYSSTLFRLNRENSKLKEANAKLSKQKKQIKVVAWLSVIIAISMIVFFFVVQSKNDDIWNLTQRNERLTSHVQQLQKDSTQLTSDLQSTKDKLRKSNNRVNALRSDSSKFVRRIDSCYTAISTLKLEKENVVKDERERARKVEKDFKSFKTNLASNPLIIYDIEIANTYENGNFETNYGGYIYSSNSMFLTPRIKYIGVSNGTYSLKVKLYTPSGLSTGSAATSPKDCSYTNSINVYSGKNEYKLLGWGGKNKGHWSKGSYKIEIWYYSTLLAVTIR